MGNTYIFILIKISNYINEAIYNDKNKYSSNFTLADKYINYIYTNHLSDKLDFTIFTTDN